MKSILILFIVVLSVFLMVGCGPKSSGKESSALSHLTPEEYNEVRSVVISYMECEECEAGELEALVALGKKVQPTLNAVLQGGPSDAKQTEYKASLEATWERLNAYSEKHPESKQPLSKEEYVALYLDNYQAQYRIRAAEGLAALGGDEAKKELQKAAGRSDLRADVVQRINLLLESMK